MSSDEAGYGSSLMQDLCRYLSLPVLRLAPTRQMRLGTEALPGWGWGLGSGVAGPEGTLAGQPLH